MKEKYDKVANKKGGEVTSDEKDIAFERLGPERGRDDTVDERKENQEEAARMSQDYEGLPEGTKDQAYG